MKLPMHYRVTIVKKAIEILTRTSAGRPSTLAEDRVYRQKYTPLTDDGKISDDYLPAIVLYVNHEDNERVDWTQDRRTCDLIVECYATVHEKIDDPLDVLTEQVAILLRRDQTLGGVAEWIHYKSSDWIYDKESESIVEGARVTYEVRYIWDSTSTLPLDDFLTADIATQIGGDTLSQTVEVPQ